jgi:hypothetical protein
MSDRALVRNAADPAQVRRAARKADDTEADKRARLRAVLQTALGRAAMWDLLERAGVFRSIYDTSARIHYNAGRQDFGHELMAALLDADEHAYLAMEAEARSRARRDNQSIDAAHTAPATGGQNDGDDRDAREG